MIKKLLVGLVLSLFVSSAFAQKGSLHLSQPLTFASNIFTRSDNALIIPHGPPQWQFIQRAACPASDTQDSNSTPAYINFPLTRCVDTNISTATASTETLIPFAHDLWVWACTETQFGESCEKQKPGQIGSESCRLRMSHTNIAMAAIESTTAYTEGYAQTNGSTGWQDYPVNAGVNSRDVLTWSSFDSSASALCNPTITATFDGSATMNITAISANGYMALGDIISGTHVPPNTFITAFVSATDSYSTSCTSCRGTTGTYTLNNAVPSNASGTVTRAYSGYQTAPVDTIVETRGRLADVPTEPQWGVSYDYEAADGRTCAQTLVVITTINTMSTNAPSNAFHSGAYNTELYTNRVDPGNNTGFLNGFCCPPSNSGCPATGYNTDALAALINDWIIVPSGSGSVTANWIAQAQQFLTTSNNKIGLRMNSTISFSDAQSLYNLLTSASPIYYGGHLWLHGNSAGGNCSTNQTYVQAVEAFSGVNVGCGE